MSDPGRKLFMGVRLKRLREERGLTQAALAAALGLSPSYLNQLENNQRPLTAAVLLKLNATRGFDMQLFSDEDEARLLAQLREACVDAPAGEDLSQAELRALAMDMPAAARLIVGLHLRYRDALEQAHASMLRLGADADHSVSPPAPYEEARDFFYARRNHVPALDEAAEAFAAELGAISGQISAPLAERLRARHDVTLELVIGDGPRRLFDSRTRRLALLARLSDGQRAFQLATQLAFLEQADLIAAELEGAGLGLEARSLAELGLAHYFAGATLLPYQRILSAAEAARYDIEQLANEFGVGFETVCHRLSTLQRPGAVGVPFIFVRSDRAGNISKRQSATDFHFSRLGGSCPLWNLYEAFAQPGRISRQLAEMPDGRKYLWVARTVGGESLTYRSTTPQFAVALGCDLPHARRVAYSDGLDLAPHATFAQIGPGCRVCERANCPQRAFPPIGRKLVVSPAEAGHPPYGFVA